MPSKVARYLRELGIVRKLALGTHLTVAFDRESDSCCLVMLHKVPHMRSLLGHQSGLAIVCAFAAGSLAFAQGARLLRPSRIAKSAHTLHVQPALAGFRINEPTEGAVKRLGAPLEMEKLGSGPDAPVSYTSAKTGITLIASPDEGVGIILVTSRNAGALDEIRVGDPRGKLLARWGPPAAGDKANALWLAGLYVITVTLDGSGHVVRLGIGLGQ